ncbi:MAG: hypothetical protein QOF60_373 [Actinomycetota bacterium]|nr:hypothetical protein [Actinomycetota bacterium]
MPDIEEASRWLARRSTRRSFLGRVGRVAVLVAGGSTIATLLVEDEAHARVCGQSGVSGKCATYDCDGGVWGWCWYATGCCADGELKKICDCCAPVNNVHGYCPSGTNVLCIVESCGADPRVQVVSLRAIVSDDPVAVSAGASRARFAEGGAPEVWLADAAQPLVASVLAPLAARAKAPLLLASGASLGAPLVAELQRLGTRKVVIQGAGLASGIDADLRRYGIVVERSSLSASTVVDLSDGVLAQLRSGDAAPRRAVCIEPSGLSLAAAPVAAAFAAAKGYPLIVGVDRAKALSGITMTYLVGPEAARRAGEVPGGQPLFSETWPSLTAEIMAMHVGLENGDGSHVSLMPEGSGITPAALLSGGGPILVHPAGTLDGVRDALFSYRDRFRSVALAGATGALSMASYYELQSIVNGFEAHKQIGVSGQGLPVIDQPQAERPLGLARRNRAPDQPTSRYWTDRISSP